MTKRKVQGMGPLEEPDVFKHRKVLRPLKAIRAKCIDCVCGQFKEIRECPIVGCTLWPYRHGKRPSADTAQRYEEYDDSE